MPPSALSPMNSELSKGRSAIGVESMPHRSVVKQRRSKSSKGSEGRDDEFVKQAFDIIDTLPTFPTRKQLSQTSISTETTAETNFSDGVAPVPSARSSLPAWKVREMIVHKVLAHQDTALHPFQKGVL